MAVNKHQLRKGDEVDVLVHIADGHPPKRKRARILQVMRNAAKVRYVDEIRAARGDPIVRFNQLELAPKVTKRRAQPKKEKPTLTASIAERHPEVTVGLQGDEDDDESEMDMEAWLDLGRQMVGPVQREIASLEQEKRLLDEEAALVEAAQDELAERMLQAKAKLKKLRAVVEATK